MMTDEAHAYGAGLSRNHRRVPLYGTAQHPHTAGTHPVGAGDKGGHVVAQDVPGDGIGLPAGQTGHDGGQIPGDNPGGTVPGQSALVEAVR